MASFLVTAALVLAFAASRFSHRSQQAQQLRELLVTGDSIGTGLDQDLKQRLLAKGIHVISQPYPGSGISASASGLNWVNNAADQASHLPQGSAVVMFLGANDGFAIHEGNGRSVVCCGKRWASLYATRVGSMMDSYIRAGARVYWLALPAPGVRGRREAALVVNGAIYSAAKTRPDRVVVIDTVTKITPRFVYHYATPVDHVRTIIHLSDRVHLNDAGANLVADAVLAELAKDYDIGIELAADDLH